MKHVIRTLFLVNKESENMSTLEAKRIFSEKQSMRGGKIWR